MPYLISVIETFLAGGVREEPAGSGTSEEASAIELFNDRLVADGQWIFAGGLSAPDRAVVIDGRPASTSATGDPKSRGPLLGGLAGGDHLGGFWLVKAADDESAAALAASASAACNRRVELRPLL